MVDTLNYTDYQLIWSTFKPLFQNQFAVQSNNKIIMEGLSNFAMMPTEDTWDFINCITDTMVIIKDSYATYHSKVQNPHQYINGGWPAATGKHYKSDMVNNLINFFNMQLFRAAFPNNIRNVVTHKNPKTITLKQNMTLPQQHTRRAMPERSQPSETWRKTTSNRTRSPLSSINRTGKDPDQTQWQIKHVQQEQTTMPDPDQAKTQAKS
jgi:hypothetical protein